MALNLNLKYKIPNEVAQLPQETKKRLRERLKVALPAGGELIRAEVARRTPVNTGILRQGVTLSRPKINMKGNPIAEVKIHETGPGVNYVRYVEFGRKSGRRPPLDPILYWAMRKKKFGKKGARQLRRLAYAITVKIGRTGTRAVKMYEKGFNAGKEKATKFISDYISEAFR